MFVCLESIKSLEELRANHLYINDLSMHDCSRDLLLASVQQSAELQQSLEQVRSFAYDLHMICIHKKGSCGSFRLWINATKCACSGQDN